MPDDDESTNNNPFVRFKQHVDRRVNAGLQNILDLPSIVSRTFAAGPPPQPKDAENTSSSAPMPGSWSRTSHKDVEPNPLQMAEESKDQIEHLLDSYRGGSREESEFGYKLFLTRSPYSPFLLDRYLGWRPVPRDAAEDHDGGHEDFLGGWTDAFLDLMDISSGVPMTDIKEIHSRNQQVRRFVEQHGQKMAMTKDTIHGWVESWAQSAKRDRKIEVLFPIDDRMFSYRSPRTLAEWIDARKEERSVFDEVKRLAEDLRKTEGISADTRLVVRFGVDGDGGPVVRFYTAEKVEPETEEDAYLSADRQTDARKKDGQILPKKWDDLTSFLKPAAEKEDKPQEGRIISSSENSKPTWSGGTKTVTKKEWIDEVGAVHTETVVSVKNAEGEETSRRVSHSVRLDDTQEDRAKSGHTPNVDNEGDAVSGKEHKKPTGWFWSRR